ncbi:hypothetical protein RHGRI_007761 [Rhododendron griersonianum]|uniref:Uncharacterized protein n=1 Tax=Rhododendron griersonianum TaxID=479676 RepID=A0AAV6KYQ7_9ERIC|nr:hypothetical protein RHGRI_007761 [Rhododendron griersonianum]
MAEAEVGSCRFPIDFRAPNPHRVTRTMWNERVLTADFRLISSWVHPNQRGSQYPLSDYPIWVVVWVGLFHNTSGIHDLCN